MSTVNVITRDNVKPLLRLFDHYYKKGVKDAIERHDDFYCRDFVEQMRSSKRFGFLDTPYVMTWKDWRFYAYPECRKKKLTKAAIVLDRIKTYTGHIAAILPMLMEYYLMGIKDWCEYPNSGKFVIFESTNYAKWSDKIKGRGFNAFYDEFLITIIERFHLEEGSEDALPKRAFDDLAELIWLLTRPLPKKRKR